MNKLYNIAIATSLVATLGGCASSNHTAQKSQDLPDVKQLCSVQKHGIENVLKTAIKYNTIAKDKGLEFRRLNVNNTDLIKAVQDGVKSGAKMVNPMHFKGKKKSKTKLEINYATQRACRFAISALTQNAEANTTYKLAIPGDGFNY